MKKLTFIVLILSVFAAVGQEQYKITFSYDAAGNQIMRDRVCINCNSTSKAPVKTDSLDVDIPTDPVAELEEELDQEKEYEIIAYPNPVTDILKVEWDISKNSVDQLVVFAPNGRQLKNRSVTNSAQFIDLDFSKYPLGMYIVVAIYADGSRQSFQVLKK